ARDEVIEPGLLLEHIRRGRLGGFALQRQVRSCRPFCCGCRLDPFDLDPESQPPDRQLTETVDRMRGREGHAVVGADHWLLWRRVPESRTSAERRDITAIESWADTSDAHPYCPVRGGGAMFTESLLPFPRSGFAQRTVPFGASGG